MNFHAGFVAFDVENIDSARDLIAFKTQPQFPKEG